MKIKADKLLSSRVDLIPLILFRSRAFCLPNFFDLLRFCWPALFLLLYNNESAQGVLFWKLAGCSMPLPRSALCSLLLHPSKMDQSARSQSSRARLDFTTDGKDTPWKFKKYQTVANSTKCYIHSYITGKKYDCDLERMIHCYYFNISLEHVSYFLLEVDWELSLFWERLDQRAIRSTQTHKMSECKWGHDGGATRPEILTAIFQFVSFKKKLIRGIYQGKREQSGAWLWYW